MKKSTLFFKVMMLMALLVPWTAWGQVQKSEQDIAFTALQKEHPNDDDYRDIWSANRKKGTISIYMNENGKLSTDGKMFKDKISFKMSDVTPERGIDLDYFYFVDNWFKGHEAWTDWGKLSKLIDVDVDGWFDQTLELEEDLDREETVPESFSFKVAVFKYNHKWFDDDYGFVEIKVNKGDGKTDISSDDISISINSNATDKEYDGTPISIEVKDDGITLDMGEDYEVYIDDTKETELPEDVKEGGYKVQIKGIGDYKGESEVKTVTITPKTLTITVKDGVELTTTVGETFTLSADDFNISDGVEKDKITLSGSIDKKAESIDGLTFSEEELKSSIKVSGDATEYKSSNYTVVYPKNGVTVTVVAKELSDKGYTVTFEGIVGNQNSKVYDGLPIPNVNVKSTKGETVSAKNYKVSYKLNNIEFETAPVDANTGSEKYEVIVTGKGIYEGTISAYFTITPRTLNIIAQEDKEIICKVGDDVSQGWNAADYLTFKTGEGEGLVTKIGDQGRDDKAKITGTIKLAEGQDVNTAGEKTLEFNVTAEADGTGSTFKLSNYKLNTESLTSTFKLSVSEKEITSGDEVTLMPEDGDESSKITIANNETETITYNGKSYTVNNEEGDEVSITDGEGNPFEGDIKNAGTYVITITKEGKETIEKTEVTLVIEKADLTVKVNSYPLEVTDMTTVESTFTSYNLVVTEEKDKATVTIDGEQGADEVKFEEGSTSLSLITPADGTWKVGENVGAIQAKDLKLDDEFDVNYNLKTENGALTITYKIDDTNKDDVVITFEGEGFEAEGTSKVYDGVPVTADNVKVTINGVELTAEDYEVVCGNTKFNVVDAGTYQVTVKLNGNYTGEKKANCEITKRDLTINFVFDTPIDEGDDLVFDIDMIKVGEGTSLADGEVLTDCIDVTFNLGNEPKANGKYDVYIKSITIKASANESNAFNPSNYNIKVQCGDVEVALTDSNGDDCIDDKDEGNTGITENPVGEVETVDPETGEGSTGTIYKKYELYLANKDYLKNDEETKEYYESEGLELFSRHDKKTTWAGGSFTIWYEHNGEVNEGGYRIFWSKNGERGDYQEVKLDEVSGYYQIRNVQSDIYVKIYYSTGFPVANEEISATDARAYAQPNKIVVITPELTDVQIISMAGAVVATDKVAGQREFANLTEGVYIVRMGSEVIKLQVRN